MLSKRKSLVEAYEFVEGRQKNIDEMRKVLAKNGYEYQNSGDGRGRDRLPAPAHRNFIGRRHTVPDQSYSSP